MGTTTLTKLSNLNFINLKDYCKIDGATDDSTNFTNAYQQASLLGMGLFHPGGTLIKGNDTLVSKVPIIGAGPGVSIIKLKNAANTDLFSGQTSSINPGASFGTGLDGTLSNFGFANITLDGNYSNQTGGPSWVLRFYGYGYTLENVVIRSGYSGGILSDWNGPSVSIQDGVEAQWTNVRVHDNKGVAGAPGVLFSGPHDSQINTLISYSNSGHNFQLGPNAPGLQLNTFHGWGQFGTGTWCMVLEAGANTLSNIRLEGANNLNCLALLSQQNVMSGIATAFGTNNAVGIKLGQAAGETPIPGQYLQSAGVTTSVYASQNIITMFFSNFQGADIQFDQGTNNTIVGNTNHSSGALYSGFLDPTNTLLLKPFGLTADGTMAKGGTNVLSATSQNALRVCDDNYHDYFNVATYTNQRVELPNAAYIQTYSDQYTTATSALRFGSGVPGSGLGSNGDFYFRVDTPGTANQRLYVKSAGAWVGIV